MNWIPKKVVRVDRYLLWAHKVEDIHSIESRRWNAVKIYDFV